MSITSLPEGRSSSTYAWSGWKKAYVALGANIGDKLATIERACDMLNAHEAIRLLQTSSLYPTKPMYVSDQDWFYNAACEIETSLSPMQLLDELQAIENTLGRVKTIDKGPRNIDLDILLYEGETVDNDRLIVPHKLMHEREFVLRPLADMIPNETIPTLDPSRTIRCYLAALPKSDPPMTPIVPFGPSQYLRPLDPHRSTKVMSILNVTPDSFSDGGTHFSSIPTSMSPVLSQLQSTLPCSPSQSLLTSLLSNPYLSHLHSTISSHLSLGATILDIGGQSSRPLAPSISADEEFSRIRPALLLAATFPSISISLDTYRASVFRRAAALVPHAQLILNDISGGLFEPEILAEAARVKASVVLMHTRGTPESMSRPPHTEYPTGLIEEIAAELKERVAAAQAAGIPRWRIVLDPGVGFAKVGGQNCTVLRELERLRGMEGLEGLPWLVGSSRKKFVGQLLGDNDARRAGGKEGRVRSAGERAWGTAATVVAAVQGGADVVRVHDVGEMRDVVAVADGIWRGGGEGE
ncbi:Dihydropteroate synthase [Myriangium duriaei CBS 260.36]|uniref:Dihydropteroate synthase n=1 Tax=Myriangium duriaei CBS 260.36 TaxID=1168546 RepID=A0A9P4IYR2_9PEZI|nr:Dihydropteroate synthase [Myriangium duriaei CBS 260.36]